MELCYRFILITSLVIGYLLSRCYAILPWPVTGFLAHFMAISVTQLMCKIVWAAILYPKLFSPLRHLPGPKPSSLLFGDFFGTLLTRNTTLPMVEW